MYAYSQLAAGEKVRGPDGCNYAVATGSRSGVFVVDFDTIDAYAEFAQRLPETFAVATARGVHLYYQAPADFPVRNSVGELASKVDVRGEGGFVVAPDSRHYLGKTYTIVDERAPVPAPAWLLEWPGLRGKETTATAPGANAPVAITSEHPDWARRLELGTERAKSAPPSIEGQKGSAALWDVALYLVRRLELPLEKCLDLVEEHFNPRCLPPWSELEIWHKLEDARDKSDMIPGVAPPGWDPKPSTPEQPTEPAPTVERRRPDPAHEYTHVPGHNVSAPDCGKVTLSDAINALTTHPDWAGVLQYDEFRRRHVAACPPLRMHLEVTGLSDSDVTGVRTWFESNGVAIGQEDCTKVIMTAAERLMFHPVREWLEALPAGDPRVLDDLAARVLHTKDAMAGEFLKRTLVGAVRRILQPGCQVDTMLVLTGKQGHGKTTFVRTLFGPEFVRSQMPDLASKDASIALTGYWAVELAELDRVLRAESSTVKEFLSRTHDDYRPPYGRADMRFARECVFIGTSNETDFLRDSSGNRRFWVIEIAERIDNPWLLEHRGEIWAAALALARAGYPHWFDDETALEDTRAAYVQTDPWHDTIREFCTGKTWIRSEDVYLQCVAKNESGALARFDQSIKRRIGDTLRRLGCEAHVKREQGRLVRGWSVPADLTNAPPSAAEVARAEREKKMAELAKN